jgi:hypothetical protein
VGAVQVISGDLSLIWRYVPLAIALSGPVVGNIIVYHLMMQHSGAQPAVLAIISWAILFWHYRASFAPCGCKKHSFGHSDACDIVAAGAPNVNTLGARQGLLFMGKNELAEFTPANGCPISRVLCEKWGFPSAQNLAPDLPTQPST